jgi:hypothetical protein
MDDIVTVDEEIRGVLARKLPSPAVEAFAAERRLARAA